MCRSSRALRRLPGRPRARGTGFWLYVLHVGPPCVSVQLLLVQPQDPGPRCAAERAGRAGRAAGGQRPASAREQVRRPSARPAGARPGRRVHAAAGVKAVGTDWRRRSARCLCSSGPWIWGAISGSRSLPRARRDGAAGPLLTVDGPPATFIAQTDGTPRRMRSTAVCRGFDMVMALLRSLVDLGPLPGGPPCRRRWRENVANKTGSHFWYALAVSAGHRGQGCGPGLRGLPPLTGGVEVGGLFPGQVARQSRGSPPGRRCPVV